MANVATNTSLIENEDYEYYPQEIAGVPGVPTPFHSYIAPPKFPTKHEHKYVQAQEKKRSKNNSAKFDVYYFDHGDAA